MDMSVSCDARRDVNIGASTIVVSISTSVAIAQNPMQILVAL